MKMIIIIVYIKNIHYTTKPHIWFTHFQQTPQKFPQYPIIRAIIGQRLFK